MKRLARNWDALARFVWFSTLALMFDDSQTLIVRALPFYVATLIVGMSLIKRSRNGDSHAPVSTPTDKKA